MSKFVSRRFRTVAVALIMLGAICIGSASLPVRADNPSVTQPHKKKNWVQRHPTLTAVGAGIATHHYLKVKAARDKREGKRLSWAERHPTLTAVGAGVVTHHIIKKTTPKDAQ